MGCAVSTAADKEAAERSKKIDRDLRADGERQAREVKLLLLGAGESGKSTIVKQMNFAGHAPYRVEWLMIFYEFELIFSSESLLFVGKCFGMKRFFSVRACRAYFLAFSPSESLLFAQFCLQLELLEFLFLSYFFRGGRDRLEDDCLHVFESLPGGKKVRYSQYAVRYKTYILRAFLFKKVFREFDLMGMVQKELKWEPSFFVLPQSPTVVFLSGQNVQVVDAPLQNRMIESMKLFDSICNNKWFVETSIILFLNKKDLFEEKIVRSPLTICFPEYPGDNTYEEAAAYIQMKFESLNKRRDTKEIYTHFTCATDTNNIQFVFDAVTDVIIKNNLKDCGLF
ncbi:unnamed protein product [Ixodes persulcatus]